MFSFDKAEVENLGLLKADILGLRTLDIIARTLELAGLTEEDLPDEFDDPKVFELFQEGDSLGLFQFETNLLTGMTKKVRPTDFETLCILTAAARPGGLNSGSTERYIKKRLGTLETSYLHPDLKQYLESTLGEIFFQEDIMKIGNEIGGIELTRAYRMIKEISKSKESKPLINIVKNLFLELKKTVGKNKPLTKCLMLFKKQEDTYSISLTPWVTLHYHI
jgi:DNA polymerase-3 subunit alpha